MNDLIETFIEKLLSLIQGEDYQAESKALLAEALEELSPEQLALVFEAIPAQFRAELWVLLDQESQRDIFLEMREETRKILIRQLSDSDTHRLLLAFDAEGLLELAEDLPERFLSYAYSQLDQEEKVRYERASQYEDDLLGHWVSFDCPRVSQKLKVRSGRNVLKKSKTRLVDAVYTVDKEGKLIGSVSPIALYEAEPETPLIEIHSVDVEFLSANTTLEDAAAELIQSGRVAMPVVDENGVLFGRFDIADAYEHLQELSDSQLAKSGGLTEEEDLFAPVWRSSKNRAVWLGINLITAFLASWFIGLFEATLQQVVALAVLMPVVASMGGISGSQTLTVIVRGLALGQVTDANRKALLKKEFRVGCLNGILWAAVIGIITYHWFDNGLLGVTISFAILLNIIAAVVSGVYVPSILHRFNFDPALSGSVILTTVTDIVGFVSFLGLGAILLT